MCFQKFFLLTMSCNRFNKKKVKDDLKQFRKGKK